MHYDYFQNLNYERDYLKDKFFASKNIKKNNTSEVLDYFIKNNNRYDNKINQYLNGFFDKYF